MTLASSVLYLSGYSIKTNSIFAKKPFKFTSSKKSNSRIKSWKVHQSSCRDTNREDNTKRSKEPKKPKYILKSKKGKNQKYFLKGRNQKYILKGRNQKNQKYILKGRNQKYILKGRDQKYILKGRNQKYILKGRNQKYILKGRNQKKEFIQSVNPESTICDACPVKIIENNRKII
ncbi:hypothetical protein H8356DRAFT_1348306 [Neocallimastix lanati (nom. inval.)]|nr:hypothetical protein H8356DRAFT_1348306 [Neocallimastix sp. JGI-2020a]